MQSSGSPRLVEFAGHEERRRTRPEMPRLRRDFFRPVITRLIERRKAMGLSQAEVNELVGCADNHLSKWEAGLFQPSIYFLLLWAESLGFRLVLKEGDGCTKGC